MTSPKQMKAWRKRNATHVRAYKNAYAKAHRTETERMRYSWLSKNGMKDSDYKRLRRYSITVQEYNDLFEKQKGRCAICEIAQVDLDRQLSVDHDHVTGKVRGLLCINCNLLLGNAKDKVDTLERGIEYLHKYQLSVDQTLAIG